MGHALKGHCWENRNAWPWASVPSNAAPSPSFLLRSGSTSIYKKEEFRTQAVVSSSAAPKPLTTPHLRSTPPPQGPAAGRSLPSLPPQHEVPAPVSLAWPALPTLLLPASTRPLPSLLCTPAAPLSSATPRSTLPVAKGEAEEACAYASIHLALSVGRGRPAPPSSPLGRLWRPTMLCFQVFLGVFRHVVSLYFKCFSCFPNVSSVSDECCKCFIRMLQK
jgi:hypothetical protein